MVGQPFFLLEDSIYSLYRSKIVLLRNIAIFFSFGALLKSLPFLRPVATNFSHFWWLRYTARSTPPDLQRFRRRHSRPSIFLHDHRIVKFHMARTTTEWQQWREGLSRLNRYLWRALDKRIHHFHSRLAQFFNRMLRKRREPGGKNTSHLESLHPIKPYTQAISQSLQSSAGLAKNLACTNPNPQSIFERAKNQTFFSYALIRHERSLALTSDSFCS